MYLYSVPSPKLSSQLSYSFSQGKERSEKSERSQWCDSNGNKKSRWIGAPLLTDIVVTLVFKGRNWGPGRLSNLASILLKTKQNTTTTTKKTEAARLPGLRPKMLCCAVPLPAEPRERQGGFSCSLFSLAPWIVLSPGWGLEGDLKFVTWMETRGLTFFGVFYWNYNRLLSF